MGILRVLLALSVVLNHSYSIFNVNLLGGPLAVQAFFIISGFYMSLILNEKYTRQEGSYKLFITNRLMRIYPVYIVVLLMAVVVYSLCFLYPTQGSGIRIFTENPVKMYAEHISDIGIPALLLLGITNIGILLQDILMFLSIDVSGDLFLTSNFRLTALPMYKFLFIPQAWSIGLECMFYLIAPFLLRKGIGFILTLIVLSFFIRFLVYSYGFTNDPWSYRFFPFELGYFLLGNISYLIYKKIAGMSLDVKYLWPFFLCILFITVGYPVMKFSGSTYVYCVFFFLCLPFTFLLTKKWKYDTYAGDLSYPIYLVHLLLLSVMQYLSEGMDKKYLGILYLAAVIGCSVLLNELISKKMEAFRQKRYTDFLAKK